MRIEATEARRRMWESLKEATGKGRKATALDTAADYYPKMRGRTSAVPFGAIEDLLGLAVEQDSVTPDEIPEVLSTDELSVEAETNWSVGPE